MAISRSETQSKSLSPWQVSLQENGLLCNLAHPHSSDGYRVHVPKFLRDATLWHSKDGWLLVNNLRRKIHILSFFNPFTKCVEKYKGLLDLCFTTSSIAFSSPPPSPNCVIVVIKVCGVRRVLICICHSKADPWRKFSRISNEDFLPADANTIFANGAFFLRRHRNVGVMRLQDGGCIWHVLEQPQVLRPSFGESFSAERDGEVYLVLTYEMGKDVQVLSLDSSTLSWNTVENLGNHTLHVSRSSALFTVAKT